MPGSNGVKIGIAVVLLSVAVVMYVRGMRQPDERDVTLEPAPVPRWTCTACAHQWQPPRDEIDRILSAKAAAAAAAESGEAGEGAVERTRTSRTSPQRVPTLPCPTCGKDAAVISTNYCAEHEAYYPNLMPDGVNGRCGKCASQA